MRRMRQKGFSRLSLLLALLSALAPSLACAESRYTLETGSQQTIDTYISPLRYDGMPVAISGYWSRQLKSGGGRWVSEGGARMEAAFMRNPSRTAREYSFMLLGGWSMSRFVQLPYDITLRAGVGADVEAGAVYLPRNGNNPASAKFYAGAHLNAEISRRFTFLRRPMRARAGAFMPVAGAMFSPEYGEPYYEIYLGNRSGLAHFAWWGNRMRLIVAPSLDISFRCGTFSLGYRYGLLSSYVNGLHTRIISHTVAIGFIPGQL